MTCPALTRDLSFPDQWHALTRDLTCPRQVMLLLWALLAAAAASPVPQEVVQDVPIRGEQQEILQGTVVIRPPKIEKVTHVTSDNQYQKLYKDEGKYK